MSTSPLLPPHLEEHDDPLPPLTVVLDANVLYQLTLRDIFMRLHEEEIVEIHWSQRIEEEFVRNLCCNLDKPAKAFKRMLEGMHLAVDGWNIDYEEAHEQLFQRVHQKDRHVAAAAYALVSSMDPDDKVALITDNIRDFVLSNEMAQRLVLLTPDQYLSLLFECFGPHMRDVLSFCQQNRRKPPTSFEGRSQVPSATRG